MIKRHYGTGILAEVRFSSGYNIQLTMADIPTTEKLEKFVDDVKYEATSIA